MAVFHIWKASWVSRWKEEIFRLETCFDKLKIKVNRKIWDPGINRPSRLIMITVRGSIWRNAMVSLFVTVGNIAVNRRGTDILGRIRWQGNTIKPINANPKVLVKTDHVLLNPISQQGRSLQSFLRIIKQNQQRNRYILFYLWNNTITGYKFQIQFLYCVIYHILNCMYRFEGLCRCGSKIKLCLTCQDLKYLSFPIRISPKRGPIGLYIFFISLELAWQTL